MQSRLFARRVAVVLGVGRRRRDRSSIRRAFGGCLGVERR